MQRRRYLVAYDIRDPKRLRLVFQTMKAYGESLQYSVFVCDISRAEKVAMQTDLGAVIDHTEDSIALVDLGQASGDGSLRFEFMGFHRPLPEPGPIVI
jgi:CRISPR-associated protein Cas2